MDASGNVVINYARNDPLMAPYSPTFLVTNRSNHDLQLVYSVQQTLDYIVSYATKAEDPSLQLRELLRRSVDLPDLSPAKRLVARCLMKYLGARTYSSQETCSLLLMDKLWYSSRAFVSINLGNSRMVTSSGEVPNAIDKYMRRPAVLETVCLFDFCQQYDVSAWKPDRTTAPKRRKSHAVVLYYPRLKWHPTNLEKQELFHEFQLRLYKPFRNLADVKGGYATFAEAYHSANLPARFISDQQVDTHTVADRFVDVPVQNGK